MALTTSASPAPGRLQSRHGRLAAGIFLLLLLVSLALGYGAYRHLVRHQQDHAQEVLKHISYIETSAVSAWVSERFADALAFRGGQFLGESVNQWVAQGSPNNDTRLRLLETLEAIKQAYGYLDVAVYDIDGSIRITTSPQYSAPGRETAETVQRALEQNTAQISSIYAADLQVGPRRAVDFATPLPGADRSGQGAILVLQANADLHLQPHVEAIPLLSATADVVLGEVQNGQVIAVSTSKNPRYFSDLAPLPLTPAALHTAAVEGAVFKLATPDGLQADAVARKVASAPWYLITMVDSGVISAGVARLAWTVAAVWLGVLALIGTGLRLWWRKKESEYQLEAVAAASKHESLRRRYDYLSRYANDMILLADADGRVLELNDKAIQVLGGRREDLIGQPLEALFSAESRPALANTLQRLQQDDAAQVALAAGRGEGCLQLDTSARAIELDGTRITQLICRDVTERSMAEATLRETEEKLNRILSSILDVVWSFSPDLSRIFYVSQITERIFGYPPTAFIEHPRLWFDAIHPEDRERVERTLRGLHAGQPFCDSEYRILRQDGMLRWVHCRGRLVIDANGQKISIDGVTSDITQRKSAEQQVQTLAYYDSVTTLPNRRLMNDRLTHALPVAQRNRLKVAVLYMDLDNFKNVNDSLGHHIGDMLLFGIAERLLKCVRKEDTVARIGGDEFLIVLPDLERSGQAVTVAEKILAEVSRPFLLEDNQIHTSTSIGISIYPDDGKEPGELMQHADSALYQAKEQGRGNYQFFTEELNRQIHRNMVIERQLRRAIDKNELQLWYQPQIEAVTGKLIGAEALLRWQQEDGHYMSPAEFIPVAEERGLISRIGEWAMREACCQCRRWQQQGLRTVPIAVNVSPIQFQQKEFADQVTSILSQSNLDATMLELEITESSIMRRATQVAELAMRLREVGVGISIDDFGTGYSSLSYLKQIPIDKIKIDRSFITDMLSDDDDNAITYAIVNLAHSLNLRVIAEGVESRAQIERLRAFGCDEVQGHFYSKAVPAQVFESFLAESKVFTGGIAPVH